MSVCVRGGNAQVGLQGAGRGCGEQSWFFFRAVLATAGKWPGPCVCGQSCLPLGETLSGFTWPAAQQADGYVAVTVETSLTSRPLAAVGGAKSSRARLGRWPVCLAVVTRMWLQCLLPSCWLPGHASSSCSSVHLLREVCVCCWHLSVAFFSEHSSDEFIGFFSRTSDFFE